ncbi:MAG: SUMF1/EgtB/PvdO family nonheme iron enzyme [bacterium]
MHEKKIFLIAIAIIFSLSFLCVLCASAVKFSSSSSAPQKYKFYILRIGGVAGESEGTVVGMLRKTVAALSKATGYDIEYLSVGGEELGNAIESGEADFTMWGSEPYAYDKDGYMRNYVSLVTAAFFGKATHKYCIYINKERGMNSLPRLAGAKLHISQYGYGWAHLAEFLDDAGIKQPVGEFFSEVIPTKDMQTSMMLLKTGDIDAVFDQSDEADYVLFSNSELKKSITTLVCSGEYANVPVLYRKGLPDEVVAKVGKALLGAHKSKDFQEVRMMFAAVNLSFKKVTKEDYEAFNKYYTYAWNKGLYSEVYEVLPPVKYEEWYKEPEDIFKGKYKEFLELEITLGKGDFKKGAAMIKRLKRSVKDKRLDEIEREVGIFTAEAQRTQRNKCPANMVYVPAGEFTMGADSPMTDEKKTHKEKTGAFCIDMYEYPNIKGVRPRVGMKWSEAKGLCAAVGKRMPTEAEWEKAARGTDGRIYPWGNAWDAKKANASGADDGYEKWAPSGSYPGGKSPYGAYDMAGNVWEMVYDWNYYSGLKTKPWKSGKAYDIFVLRGGSWNRATAILRASSRYGLIVNWRSDLGFRCAQDL